ncbi:MAG TPA: hypothetical protein VHM93_02570 [Candidatus Acidoferrum sp.]|jgi:hypothetical protein|nr:hypothetical protein [Candidatus Acidoferrum sp.]
MSEVTVHLAIARRKDSEGGAYWIGWHATKPATVVGKAWENGPQV